MSCVILPFSFIHFQVDIEGNDTERRQLGVTFASHTNFPESSPKYRPSHRILINTLPINYPDFHWIFEKSCSYHTANLFFVHAFLVLTVSVLFIELSPADLNLSADHLILCLSIDLDFDLPFWICLLRSINHFSCIQTLSLPDIGSQKSHSC